MPQGTYLAYPERVIDVIKTIMDKNKSVIYSDKSEIIRVLKEAVQKDENKEVQNKHIKNVRDMLGKDRIFE
jgi:ethanolamine ammonia-lyase large subunit